MGVLNYWQRIDRVLPGTPFGDGADGDYSSSTIPPMVYRSCSGSSGLKTLTLSSSGFSNGDVILIHQTRGTGAGQWEINRIVSGGGTTSLTLQKSLQYTYTDGGASQAQVIKIPRYRNVTVPYGATWTIPSWNGDIYGILPLAVKETFTQAGAVVGNGSQGADQVWSGGGAIGGGFWGGDIGRQGEGSGGARGADSRLPNGTGGGGANSDGTNAGGGGGGGATAGIGGNYQPNGATAPGQGGGVITTADLSVFTLGGGGGGGEGTVSSGAGGSGGAVFFVIAKQYILTGSVSLRGGRGGYPYEPWIGGRVNYGGGGGGGNFLLMCQYATLGTNLINASSTTTYNGYFSEGGQGGIAIHYSGYVSGTTTPTAYTQFDSTLTEPGGGFLLNFV